MTDTRIILPSSTRPGQEQEIDVMNIRGLEKKSHRLFPLQLGPASQLID